MKLKLLTLLLTIGIFAFDTSVNAEVTKVPSESAVVVNEEEKVGDIADVVKKLICGAIDSYLKGNLPKCCTGICDTEAVDLTTLGTCAATIYAFPQDEDRCKNYPTTCDGAKKVVSTTQAACNSPLNLACSGPACSASSTIKKACGYVCCNMKAPDEIKTCIGEASKCGADKYNQPDCLTKCTGDCCPDKDGNYCTDSVCTANDGVCPASKTLIKKQKDGKGGW